MNAPLTAIAAFCEGVLLGSSFADVAYARYAVEATYSTTNLATFKAIVKKYPGKPRETILRDLVASQPGQEGKWFAAAKDAGFFELAIELANRSPSDPRTLIRAARDFAEEQPEFAGYGQDRVAWHRQWMGLRHHRYRRVGRLHAMIRRPAPLARMRLWSERMCGQLLRLAPVGTSL